MTIDQAKRDELRRLMAAADPAPWRFEIGDYNAGGGHIVTSAPIDKPWSESPILCSHIFGPRDAANYALMAAAPTAIPELLTEVDILESQARSDRNLIDAQWAEIHTQRKRIETLEAERTVDAQAFVSPAERIENLEHELADLRESETTQATRIASLEFRLKVADAEVASLRLRVEAWATMATGISR